MNTKLSGACDSPSATEADVKLDAILPAGGRIGGRFAAEVGTTVKTLISFAGQSILERTLSALRETGRIGRIVVIGPEEVHAHLASRAADAVLPDAGSAAGNIFRGLDWLRETPGPPNDRALVLTTDLPFITPAAISHLLDACPADGDICLPVIRRDEFEARFPNAPRRYSRLRDGQWVIAGSALVNVSAIQRNRLHIARAYATRRNFFGLACLLGPRFLLRCACRRATMANIEGRCQEILHCRALAVRGCPPELAHDIDRYPHYRYAVAVLGRGES